MGEPLDNPVWHALTGPHAQFAFGRGAARHYPRDVAPFSAIAEPTAAAYRDLAADLPPGLEARLFRPTKEATPPGWETISARPIVQMVADGTMPEPAAIGSIVPLGEAGAEVMLALAEAARPGPFGRRTVLLGNYVGVRRDGRLVAMAGERFRLQGHVELSAICVDPEWGGMVREWPDPIPGPPGAGPWRDPVPPCLSRERGDDGLCAARVSRAGVALGAGAAAAGRRLSRWCRRGSTGAEPSH